MNTTVESSPRSSGEVPEQGPIFLWREQGGREEGLVLFVSVCPFPGCPDRCVLLDGFLVSRSPGVDWRPWEVGAEALEPAWAFAASLDVDGGPVRLEEVRKGEAVEWLLQALDDELRAALRERFERERALRDAVLGERPLEPGRPVDAAPGWSVQEIPPERVAAVLAGLERGVRAARGGAAPAAQARAASPRIGRNQPCPCGSGKKYKRCCEGRVN